MSSDSLADTFQGKIDTFIANVSSTVANKKVPAWIKPFMDSIKILAQDVSDAFAELEGRLSVQMAVTDGLSKDREVLQEKLHLVDGALQDQLQYSRRNMLLIHGIEETDGLEDTDSMALEVFKKIDVPMDKSKINRSHRLGRRIKAKQDKKKSRPIIVSFTSYQEKFSVFNAKKKLKGSKTLITESLTKSRYELLQQCWETYGKDKCWSYDGRIYVAENDTKFCVTSAEDLAERRT